MHNEFAEQITTENSKWQNLCVVYMPL